MSGYYLLREGEFAYNKSTSGESPWGAVKRLEKYEKGCVSTLYICFALDDADPNFLITYYETDRWYKAVQIIAAEGARNHGLLNIAPDDFFDTFLTLPSSREEQERIGSLFARLDSLITLHQRKQENVWHQNGAWNGLTNPLVFRTPLAASSPSCTPTVARMDAADGADRVAAGSVPMAQIFVCAPGDASAAEPSERPFALRGMPRAPGGGDRLEP